MNPICFLTMLRTAMSATTASVKKEAEEDKESASYIYKPMSRVTSETDKKISSLTSELENLEIDTRSYSSGTTSLIMCMEDLLN